MNTIDWNVGGKTYELKLTTRNVIKLEKHLKKNPLSMFLRIEQNELPALEEVCVVLLYALQPLHSVEVRNLDNVYDIYDAYVEDGGSLISILPIIVDIFKESGLIPKGTEDATEKN